jgi:hypothetical protein
MTPIAPRAAVGGVTSTSAPHVPMHIATDSGAKRTQISTENKGNLVARTDVQVPREEAWRDSVLQSGVAP